MRHVMGWITHFSSLVFPRLNLFSLVSELNYEENKRERWRQALISHKSTTLAQRIFNCFLQSNNLRCLIALLLLANHEIHPLLWVLQAHWLGSNYFLRGPKGNDIHRTNVPNLRIAFRHEVSVFGIWILIASTFYLSW